MRFSSLKLNSFLFLTVFLFTQAKAGTDLLAYAQEDDGDKYGYVNQIGDWIITPQYDIAAQFSDGLAYVEKGDSAFFIDATNTVQLRTRKFENVPYFYNDIAVVEIQRGNYGCINKKGDLLFYNFSEIGNFKDGFMTAVVKNYGRTIKLGYINLKGEWVITVCNECAITDFENGLTAIRGQNKLWGYWNRDFKEVVAPKYTLAGQFKENLARIYTGNKFGYIDTTGKVAIPAIYVTATNFCEGYALVMDTKFDRKIINKKGEIVASSVYSDYAMQTFHSGLAAVHRDGKTLFIDVDKNEVFQFDGEAYNFHLGCAIVKVEEKYGLVNKKGKSIVTTQYERLGNLVDPNANNDFWGH